jgi:hypothetical protein
MALASIPCACVCVTMRVCFCVCVCVCVCLCVSLLHKIIEKIFIYVINLFHDTRGCACSQIYKFKKSIILRVSGVLSQSDKEELLHSPQFVCVQDCFQTLQESAYTSAHTRRVHTHLPRQGSLKASNWEGLDKKCTPARMCAFLALLKLLRTGET